MDGGITGTIMDSMKKLGYLGAQYGLTAYHWNMKFLKVQLQKWKKCGAQKKMNKVYSSLGSEVYSLHKQGEADWRNMPSVQQQLKVVEETESKVFDVDEFIEEINKEFENKKDELKDKYSSMRADVGKNEAEE